MDEALSELINAVKEMSPVVWEAALVRVQVQGLLDLGLAGLSLIAGLSLAWLSRYSYKYAEGSDVTEEAIAGLTILCGILAAFCIIPLIGNLYWGLLYLLSPEWAAIKLILEQVK